MPEPEIPEHVLGLMQADVYPHAVDKVELVQTAISYVLLAGQHVYKLKKPVDLGFLDFTTLEKRKHDCDEEVRLNARGCQGLHYGVEAVVKSELGYRLGGAGEVVDYAVHMRRLPQHRMMDELVARNEVTFDMMGRLVQRLVEMYGQSERGERITAIGGLDTLRQNWRENFEQIQPCIGHTLSRATYDHLLAFVDGFIAREEPLLRRREAEGWVRDCHGDLRTDSVCFDDSSPAGICLYDCIEFNERFRFGDTGLDVAFLAMDLDFRGRPDLSDLLTSLYAAAMGDSELPLLLDLYRAYRAVVRGKVESLLLDDESIDPALQERAAERARRYFLLAERYANAASEPARSFRGIVMVTGLSGSGKSVLAGCLADHLGAVLLASDMLRSKADSRAGRGPEAVGTGRYSDEARGAVYAELTAAAERYLQDGRVAVLDATFIQRDQRQPVVDLARRLGAGLVLIECVAPESLVEKRQRERQSQDWTRSEGRWEVYLAQKQSYEPPEEVPKTNRLTVDTSTSLAEQLTAVTTRLSRPAPALPEANSTP